MAEESLSPSLSETCVVDEIKHIADKAQEREAVAVKDEVIIDPVIDEVNTSTEGEGTAAVEVLPLHSEESLESLSESMTRSSSLLDNVALEEEKVGQAVDTTYASETIEVTEALSATADPVTELTEPVNQVAVESTLITPPELLNDSSPTVPITDEASAPGELDSSTSPPLALDVTEHNDAMHETAETRPNEGSAAIVEETEPPASVEHHIEEKIVIDSLPSEHVSITTLDDVAVGDEVAELRPDIVDEADLSSKLVAEELVAPTLTAESGSDAPTVKVKTEEDVGGDSNDRQPDSTRETTAFSEPVAGDLHAPTLTTVGVSEAVAGESETRQVKGMVGHGDIAPSIAERPHEDDGAEDLTNKPADVTVVADVDQLESDPAVERDQSALPTLSIFVDGQNSDPLTDDMEELTAGELIGHKERDSAVVDGDDSDSLSSINETNTFSAFLTVIFFILIIALFSVREGTYRGILLSILLWPFHTLYSIVYTVINVLFGWVYTILYSIVYGRSTGDETGVEYGEDNMTDSDNRYQTSNEVDAGTPTRSSGGRRQGASPSSTGIHIHS